MTITITSIIITGIISIVTAAVTTSAYITTTAISITITIIIAVERERPWKTSLEEAHLHYSKRHDISQQLVQDYQSSGRKESAEGRQTQRNHFLVLFSLEADVSGDQDGDEGFEGVSSC